MRNVFFVNWFNTKLQQWALWVLDATSSCTDSLLVSHQPSFLSLSLSLLLFSLCWRAQTEQHQHCCPHLCPPALCSTFTHWRVRISRLGRQETHTLPSTHYQQVMILAFPTPCILSSAANTLQSCYFVITKTLSFLHVSLSRPALKSSLHAR